MKVTALAVVISTVVIVMLLTVMRMKTVMLDGGLADLYDGDGDDGRDVGDNARC